MIFPCVAADDGCIEISADIVGCKHLALERILKVDQFRLVELQYADFTNTVLVVALPVIGVVFAICAFVGAVLTAIVIIRKKRAA